ncbi:MAG TPA: hypothetical protein VEX62_03125 [Candidatus Limnocylindrales bacterium]|nr:hypothetical protein [Candidatus Limnocylindrales bacterium]
MRPNPPRMVTVVLAVALMVIGLALVFFQGQTIDIVRDLGLPNDVQRQLVQLASEQIAAWAALVAAPVLLIVGSLLPNI